MSRDLFISAPHPSFAEYYATVGLRFDSEQFLGLKELNKIGREVNALDSDGVAKTLNGVIAQYEERQAAGYFNPPMSDVVKLLVNRYVADISAFGQELGSAIDEAQHKYEVNISSSDQLWSSEESLQKAISHCESALFVVTPLTMASNQLAFEYGAAKQAKRPIYRTKTVKSNLNDFLPSIGESMLIEAATLKEATQGFVERAIEA